MLAKVSAFVYIYLNGAGKRLPSPKANLNRT